jgi:hypothetical protein
MKMLEQTTITAGPALFDPMQIRMMPASGSLPFLDFTLLHVCEDTTLFTTIFHD